MRPAPLALLAAASCLAGPGFASGEDLVTVDLDTWLAMQPVVEEPEPELLPGPHLASRTIDVVATAGGLVEIVATFDFDTWEPGWLEARLFEQTFSDVVVLQDGGPAAWDVVDGAIVATDYVDGPTTFTVRATVEQNLEQRPLMLHARAAAARAVLNVSLPDGFDPVVTGSPAVSLGADGVVHRYAAHGAVSVRAEPSATTAADRTDVVGEVGLGLTVGDSTLSGRARLRWLVLSGSLDRVSFTVSDAGADLAITGDAAGEITRSGDRVTVLLNAPARDLVELDLAWTSALPDGGEGQVPVPAVRLDGARRAVATLQLARDGEWEALPALRGWKGTSSAALPSWGRGLVAGTPTAAFEDPARSDRGGALALLRFEPVSGPPVVVDVADYLVATTADGRALVRARYEVLNETASHLDVELPLGATPLAVRVAGETAPFTRVTPADDRFEARTRGDVIRIPIPRSVETVEGGITFPVELAWLHEGEPWERRVERALPLARIEAPVAVARVTVHLPPGYTERTRGGPAAARVSVFSEGEGIAYGYKVTDDEAARDKADEADLLFQSAVGSWMDNEFDDAQAALDELAALGASNDNVVRLQSNLDLVTERGDEPDADEDGDAFDYDEAPTASAGEAMKRRVREQAAARSADERRAYEEVTRRAAEKERAGDYEGAEEDYRQALELGGKLAGLEQEESSEVEDANRRLSTKLVVVGKKKKSKAERQRKIAALVPEDGAPSRHSVDTVRSEPASSYTRERNGTGSIYSGEAIGGYGRGASGMGASGYGAGGGYYGGRSSGLNFEATVIEGAVAKPGIDPLVVAAAHRSVLVPRVGEPVFFQQLLLASGGTPEVTLRAKRLPER